MNNYVQLTCPLLINLYLYLCSYTYFLLYFLLLFLFYSNTSNQVIIEGFKPHDEPKLAVDDISFSREQCETIASKYPALWQNNFLPSYYK